MRHADGSLSRMAEAILDERGMIARPWKHKTRLLLLYERQIIDKDQLQAGEIFRAKFCHAALDQLHALDPSVALITRRFAPNAPGEHIQSSRDYIWSRICVLGGLSSLPGSCAWSVLGMEISLRAWATERALHGRPIYEHEARGILVSVLTTLSLDTTSKNWRPPVPQMHEDRAVHLRKWLAPA
jgi:hypothetical protein